MYLTFWIIHKQIFIEIKEKNQHKWNNKVTVFESQLKHMYPLNDDKFSIDHGPNYFSFFNRLGSVYYYTIINNKVVKGTCAMILRNINKQKVWYMCDLKINEEYRNRYLLSRLVAYNLFNWYCKSNKMYGICMNPCQKLTGIVNKFRFFGFKTSGNLIIYMVDYNIMMSLHRILEQYQGSISYLSLLGIKDLVLQSTNKPMKLLHLQHGKAYNRFHLSYPVKNYKYMFCLHETHQLTVYLKPYVYASATIVHYNMNNFNWNHILTSDI